MNEETLSNKELADLLDMPEPYVPQTEEERMESYRKGETEFGAMWSSIIDECLDPCANCWELVWRGPDFVRVFRTEATEQDGKLIDHWVEIDKKGYEGRTFDPLTNEITYPFIEYRPSQYGHEFEFEWVDSDSCHVHVGFYDGGEIWDANVFNADNGDHLSPMGVILYTAWAMREATRLLVKHDPEIEIAGCIFNGAEAGL